MTAQDTAKRIADALLERGVMLDASDVGLVESIVAPLVAEPAASVEGTVAAMPFLEQPAPQVKIARRGWFPAWPGAKVGDCVRVVVHKVTP